ncbi:MAG: hypothetical protein O4805_01450 [Trichodesmium sp. St16_bin2-tuft]|nr:hypothetical protein [Trichodesmium sp. St16_bin2-tuft]MDE5111470.1 hypothetical protein [Trichodesmium sp. St7_bin2_1]
MHTTSLQSFGYGDVVHQFKKRYITFIDIFVQHDQQKSPQADC